MSLRQRDREWADIHRAAASHGIEILDSLRLRPHADFEIGSDLRASLLGNRHRVAGMVVMAVREENMRHPFRHTVNRQGLRKGRIA